MKYNRYGKSSYFGMSTFTISMTTWILPVMFMSRGHWLLTFGCIFFIALAFPFNNIIYMCNAYKGFFWFSLFMFILTILYTLEFLFFESFFLYSLYLVCCCFWAYFYHRYLKTHWDCDVF